MPKRWRPGLPPSLTWSRDSARNGRYGWLPCPASSAIILRCPATSTSRFRWREEVIYWEGSRGVVFPGAWGVSPFVTVIPDATTWDKRVPSWLRGPIS